MIKCGDKTVAIISWQCHMVISFSYIDVLQHVCSVVCPASKPLTAPTALQTALSMMNRSVADESSPGAKPLGALFTH